MKITVPYFDGFHIQTPGRRRLSKEQKMARQLEVLRQKSFILLAECFRRFIPKRLLRPSEKKAHSHRRVFSKENTFRASCSQVIDAADGCMGVVRKIQAYSSLNALTLPASSSSAYCQARSKLEKRALMGVFKHTVKRPEQMPERGRRVTVADGTGVTGHSAGNVETRKC